MPIYAYRCEACGFAKDVLQKISDSPLTACPSCDQPAFKKQVTAAGFQLKGSGWYVTDFRSGSGGAAAPATGSSAAPSSEAPAASSPEPAAASGTTDSGASTAASGTTAGKTAAS